MRRRRFMTLLGGTVATPFGVGMARRHQFYPLMATLELFPDADLGFRRPAGDNCARPIGKRYAGRHRRADSARKSPIARQVHELRLLIETQHAELLVELRGLRQERRDEHELPSAILRRLVEIERLLRIIEPATMPRLTRRQPVG
jgi:hypothetical protein